MAEPIRIANCSGFYGDRLSAAAEMVNDGPIDVLTGDWLAELTMLILARTRSRRPGGGYARSFVKQLEQVMGACLDAGIKVVSNAGGLDPRGCGQAVAEVAERLGLSPRIACVDGDDLMGRLDPEAADAVTLALVLHRRGDGRHVQDGHRQRICGRLGHRGGSAPRRRHRRDRAGSPTRRWCLRTRGLAPRLGHRTTGTSWPGRWQPGT